MHGIQRKNQANSPDDSRSDHSRMREFRVESQYTKNQKHKENIRLDNARKESLPRRKFEACARGILQRERHLCPVEARDGPAIQLPKQVLRRAHDQINHLRFQRFFFGKGLGFGDRLFCQLRVAFAPLRKTPQKRHGILVDLLSKYFIDLLRKSADRDDRRSRACMCAGRHRRNIGRQKNIETCRSSARARRRNVHGHRHRGDEDVLNHVLHRIAQAARSIHGDQNQRRMTSRRVL